MAQDSNEASSHHPGSLDHKAMPPARGRRHILMCMLFAAVITAIVVVPWLLFGERFDQLTRALMEDPSSQLFAAAAGALLLAADVVFPIPSTVVVSLLGGLLGALNGTIAGAAGLTLGCVAGYALGRSIGHDLALRTMGSEDFAYLSGLLGRHGVVILALCRPVPVLAEASVIAAGVTGVSVSKVLLVTTLANVGFSAVYAGLGAAAQTPWGQLAVLAASLGLPFAAITLAKRVRRANGQS